jgi:hypothetical protein
MRYFIPFILLGLGLTACADDSSSDASASGAQVAAVAKADTTQPTPAIAEVVLPTSDTIVVAKQAAIFIRPNSARIDKEKQKGDEEGFAITTNDYLYYMSTAQEFLDSVKVPIIDVSDEKFILFAANGKKGQLLEVDKLPELWSIYLFKPGKKAKQVDMTIIEEECQSYFN